MVDICGYELPTNLQNFRQNDLTEVKICQKVFLGGATFFKDPVELAAFHTIQYDTVYLTYSKKLTDSQLRLSHGMNKKVKEKLKIS